MLDWKRIEQKWQAAWQESRIFEANADSTKAKYFVTFPYPYMNGFMHVGHLYTYARGDVFARFKRMQGFHVLYPQAWHCTGSPIESAAQRIKENEPSQLQIMKEMGFSDLEIGKFADPKHWVEFFPKEFKQDFLALGFSIDFRREFITTSLNPYYDKFIQWQFRKLKEKGYVVLGSHPVVWCPKENMPVPDHSRVEGEGETPQEFTLLKFKSGDAYLVAATLRPETLYGETNIWVRPDAEYERVSVGDEIWIVSSACVQKLMQQKDVASLGSVRGSDLVGKYVIAPLTKKQLLVLPAEFPDPNRGTGIVGSVPSDDPDDFMALRDLQRDGALAKKYGLDVRELAELQPLSIIRSEEFGDLPAPKVCEQMKILSQHERKKLDEAKKVIYKRGFYAGILNDHCGKYAGIPVDRAKDLMKKDLMKTGEADVFHELTGKVVCRCLTPSVVKIVTNQWFIAYGNPAWKAVTHEALKRVKLYPEKVRPQFEYVLDWLNDWACTREFGLGSRLPWDEQWVIESLSDSTIYMAFYTIVHLLRELPLDEVNDELFDYVLLGKGKAPDVANVEEMRDEFMYWYPVDFRNSGKDLVQNHFAFFLFNHAAIFPEKHWPLGIGVNGWTTVDGKKMAKSAGNFLMIRNLLPQGADALRVTMLYGGEGLDDANFDQKFLEALPQKLEALYDFCCTWHAFKGREDMKHIDAWFASRVQTLIRDATPLMEETLFRNALQKIFFDVQQAMRWYLKRTNNNPNKAIVQQAIEAQVLMLAPFAPHLCEEVWKKLGKQDFVSLAQWPEVDAAAINPEFDTGEALVLNVLDDVKRVLALAKVEKPRRITVFVAPPWKFEFVQKVKTALDKTRDIGAIVEAAKVSGFEQECAKLVPALVKNPAKIAQHVLSQEKELHIFFENKDFFKEEFQTELVFAKADESKEFKAQQALPGKPAIFVE